MKSKQWKFISFALAMVVPTIFAAEAPGSVGAANLPVVGIWLKPWGGLFQSWGEYRQAIIPESLDRGGYEKFHNIKIFSVETVVRRADTGVLITRIPYQGPIGAELDDQRPNEAAILRDRATSAARANAFSDDQVRVLAKALPGDFLLAVYVNGVRASNVIKVRLDPAFDIAKAPTLQLSSVEPHPRASEGQVVLWAIGPTPADPGLRDLQLRFLPYTLDGVKIALGFAYSGPPPRALKSGERLALWVGRDGRGPAIDPAKTHSFSASYDFRQERGTPGTAGYVSIQSKHYEAGPMTFDPQAHPLGDAWDKASSAEEKQAVAPTSAPMLKAPDAAASAKVP